MLSAPADASVDGQGVEQPGANATRAAALYSSHASQGEIATASKGLVNQVESQSYTPKDSQRAADAGVTLKPDPPQSPLKSWGPSPQSSQIQAGGLANGPTHGHADSSKCRPLSATIKPSSICCKDRHCLLIQAALAIAADD